MSGSQLPASRAAGQVTVGQAVAEFGPAFNRLSALYGVAAGVPTSGRITLSNMFNKAASVPATGAVSVQRLDSLSATVSSSSTSSSFVTDAFGLPVTYTVVSYPLGLSSVQLQNSSNGSLNFTAPMNTSVSGNIVVRATNRFGRSNILSIPVDIGLRPAATASNVALSGLSNVAVSVALAPFFLNSPSTFQISSNPRGTASLSGGNLVVTPSNLNTNYTVQVTASNLYGLSVPRSISVTEVTGVRGPVLSLDSRTLASAGLTEGASVSAWGPLTQTNAAMQPTFSLTNGTYVRMNGNQSEPARYLTGAFPSGTWNVSTGGGAMAFKFYIEAFDDRFYVTQEIWGWRNGTRANLARFQRHESVNTPADSIGGFAGGKGNYLWTPGFWTTGFWAWMVINVDSGVAAYYSKFPSPSWSDTIGVNTSTAANETFDTFYAQQATTFTFGYQYNTTYNGPQWALPTMRLKFLKIWDRTLTTSEIDAVVNEMNF